MNSVDTLTRAAILLDDLGSRTLSQPDFYRNLVEAAEIAGELASPVVRDGAYYGGLLNTREVVNAAQCMIDLWNDTDLIKWQANLNSAQSHAVNLYRISEAMK